MTRPNVLLVILDAARRDALDHPAVTARATPAPAAGAPASRAELDDIEARMKLLDYM